MVKIKSNQDTYVYTLISRAIIVYIGITNDPQRRLSEHKKDNKVFSSMTLCNKRAMKKENAEVVERRLIREFRNKYGQPPKYNISHNGQYIYGGSNFTQKKIIKRIKQVRGKK